MNTVGAIGTGLEVACGSSGGGGLSFGMCSGIVAVGMIRMLMLMLVLMWFNRQSVASR